MLLPCLPQLEISMHALSHRNCLVYAASLFLAVQGCGGGLEPHTPTQSIVSSISVAPTAATIHVGQTLQLQVTIKYTVEGDKPASIQYAPAGGPVLTVSATGLVTGLSTGDESILVYTQEGGIAATVITVAP